ncbi:hypothetical protein QAD02_008761 [Eretmocerus hayati]|uniref:Uncharacterized protein n=1 Tax=Eretmocerus hayati TaxID=131215 RepID=A0ACC2N9U9_9HYME|nr:hypothetical protein QAD02_008761 [Eretmocerus hayati]
MRERGGKDAVQAKKKAKKLKGFHNVYTSASPIRVVLSACSTYFDTILSQYEEKDPIVIMRDVKFSDIKVLVEFMYKGEINIDHTRLSSLLKTAEDLHIKGLAEVSWRSDSGGSELGLNSGHSPGSGGPPGVETVLREGHEQEDPPPPKQRRRGRPPLDDPPSAHDVFTPKITCLTGNEDMSEGDHESWDDDMTMTESNEHTMPIQLSYMPKDDGMCDQEKKANSNSNALNPAIPEQFRDVIKMNDYLTTGRRQEFWEEPFTRRVMDAIKSKELEMKSAAEILGVSYGTLYGRYRDSYGCLKHPYRVRDFWSEPGPAEILSKLRRKEITLFRAAEFLNVTVHTLATYLSTLQGPDRISLAGDLSIAAANALGANPMEISSSNSGSDMHLDSISEVSSMNDILAKINASVAPTTATAATTSATLKREGSGYAELPQVGQVVPKPSVLDNNPDITIVKTEGGQRKRVEYTKLTATENNNAKLMSGGAVSELAQTQHSHSDDKCLPFEENGKDYEYCPPDDEPNHTVFPIRRKKSKKPLATECVFCKNNELGDDSYKTHILKDEEGRTICPILRKYKCPICGAIGDEAHTIKYCPLGKKNAPIIL